MEAFKDLFSDQSSNYSKFRPTYPKQLFEYLSSLCSSHDRVWDCATGSGQAAVLLSPFFKEVIATDASANQLANATKLHNIQYRIEQAESPGFESESVDLITIAQALHWFNWSLFYPEVNRILKPNGIIAAIAYGLPDITPEIDLVIRHFHNIVLKNYWEQERQLVADLYKDIPFPFPIIDSPQFYIEKEMEFEELIGYIATWSALKKFRETNQVDPIIEFSEQMKLAWPSENAKMRVVWPLSCKIGKRQKNEQNSK